MKNILVIGSGRSAVTLIKYLLENSVKNDWKVTVADYSLDSALDAVDNNVNGRAILFNVEDELQRSKEIKGSDIVISMLPASLHFTVAKDCIKFKKNLVTASYVSNEIAALNDAAKNARVEGGDVLVCNDHIFVGYSEKEDFDKYIVSRTNRLAINFLSQNFPAKEVKGFELNKSDVNPRNNALHLDCCFQPIGKDKAIIHKAGFKRAEDIEYLANYFGAENLIEINTEEMYNMNANVFSISEKVIVSDRNFTRLNYKLKQHGFTVEEISYSEIGKMSGLLRCSTMPLVRR